MLCSFLLFLISYLFIFCLCFVCQIQFQHPTEVFLPSRSQKVWNKENKYRTCQSRDKGDNPSTWSGRLSSSAQGLQAVTAQTASVYRGGTSRHSALIHKTIERTHVLIMCWNSCVAAQAVNWLHVSLQAAPLALQPSCNMRPWSPESSLQKKKMRRNCYRWGSAAMIEMAPLPVTVNSHKKKGFMYWLMLTPPCDSAGLPGHGLLARLVESAVGLPATAHPADVHGRRLLEQPHRRTENSDW